METLWTDDLRLAVRLLRAVYSSDWGGTFSSGPGISWPEHDLKDWETKRDAVVKRIEAYIGPDPLAPGPSIENGDHPVWCPHYMLKGKCAHGC